MPEEIMPFGEELMITTPPVEKNLGSIACIASPGTTEQDDTMTTLKGEDRFHEGENGVTKEEIRSLA